MLPHFCHRQRLGVAAHRARCPRLAELVVYAPVQRLFGVSHANVLSATGEVDLVGVRRAAQTPGTGPVRTAVT